MSGEWVGGADAVAGIGPDTEQFAWRVLFEDLRAYGGSRWLDEVIVPWADRSAAVISELHEIGRPECHRLRVGSRAGHHSALEGLYAMSRVLDVLIAPFQPVSDDPALLDWTRNEPWWRGRLPDAAALPGLASLIGAVRISQEGFHPFFHEIVGVEPAEDPVAPPELVGEVWPGYLAGGLLLARSGVIVRAGSAVMDPVVAATSRMYWAWWRRNRRPTDQSHGWGSNSQWGTDFRRDYIADGEVHYNVDHHQHVRDDELPDDIALELVRHRCDLTVDHGDQWPYGHSVTEPWRPKSG